MPTALRSHRLLGRWLLTAWSAWLTALIAIALILFVVPDLSRKQAYKDFPPVMSSNSETQMAPEYNTRLQQYRQAAWLLFIPSIVLLFAHLPNAVRREQKRSGQPVHTSPQATSSDINNDATMAHAAVARPSSFIGHQQRYRLDRVLATGGMGLIHRGFDTVLQRTVAIKELAITASTEALVIERFRQEALALAALTHPNIVMIYDLLEDNGRFWFVMELLPGGNLDARIRAQEKVDIAAQLAIIIPIAEALGYAHSKGFIHRDIKPLNILFTADDVPKLTDFGIAKLSQQSEINTLDGIVLGSPGYMSPEQAAGQQIDQRADIYSLGITLYKMLTRRVPFEGETTSVLTRHITQAPPPPREFNPDIPVAVNAIIMKMLEKDPNDRYQNLADFVADIAPLV